MSTQLTGKIRVSQHAIDETVKDFRIPREFAVEWVMRSLRKSRYIANIISKDGNPSRLFCYQRAAFILADSEDFVITVYENNSPDNRMHSKIEALAMRELQKIERKERATERRVRIEKAKLAVEMAECRLRMEITPSKSVVAKNNAKLTQINERIAELDAELVAVKREKSSLAKSVVAYL